MRDLFSGLNSLSPAVNNLSPIVNNLDKKILNNLKGSIEEDWISFRDFMRDLERRYVPVRRRGGPKKPMWMTYGVRRAVINKRKVFAKHKDSAHPIYPHCRCSILIHGQFITDTIHSSTPKHLKAHQTTSRGTLSKAFSRSTKAIQSSLFLAKYFSCSWRTMKIASVVLFPAIKPNCILSIFTIFLTLLSMTLSRTFMACSTNFIPLYEPHASASPFPL